MIQSIFKVSVLAACLLASQVNAQSMNLKIGVAAEPYPPFTVKSASGQWTGFEVDLVNAICKKLQLNVRLLRHLGMALFQHSLVKKSM